MQFNVSYVEASPALSGIRASVVDLLMSMQTGTSAQRRESIRDLQTELLKHPQIEPQLTHHFLDGLYVRELAKNKDDLTVTQTHGQDSFGFLLKGHLTVATEDGMYEMFAPYFYKTVAPVKRAIYAHEDSILITIHPNPDNERDIEKLEARIAMPDLGPLGE